MFENVNFAFKEFRKRFKHFCLICQFSFYLRTGEILLRILIFSRLSIHLGIKANKFTAKLSFLCVFLLIFRKKNHRKKSRNKTGKRSEWEKKKIDFGQLSFQWWTGERKFCFSAYLHVLIWRFHSKIEEKNDDLQLHFLVVVVFWISGTN